MAGEGEQYEEPPTQQWHYPDTIVGQSQETDPDETRLVVLCRMPLAEARAACVRLESNGLPCELGEQTADQDVSILVRQDDYADADQILRRPAELDELEKAEDDKTRDDVHVRHWICPTCRERTLELVPLSRGVAAFRLCGTALLILPLIATLVSWLFPSPAFSRAVEDPPEWIAYSWIAVFLILMLQIIVSTRQKHCPKCGWRSDAEEN